MDETVKTAPKSENTLSLPVAIIVAGALIAGAVFLSRAPASTPTTADPVTAGVIDVLPISADDHFLGNPDAPFTFIEFSDLECPYCKTFHTTMKSLMDEYGKTGDMAWAYRHLPLISIHPLAQRKGEMVECVDELSNKTATWNFINNLFDATPINARLEEGPTIAVATKLGIDKTKLESCLASGSKKALVEADMNDAIKAGGRGTPFVVILLKNELSEDQVAALRAHFETLGAGASELLTVDKDRSIVSISGALPVEFMKEFISIMKG